MFHSLYWLTFVFHNFLSVLQLWFCSYPLAASKGAERDKELRQLLGMGPAEGGGSHRGSRRLLLGI
jgi:hypothetical protein